MDAFARCERTRCESRSLVARNEQLHADLRATVAGMRAGRVARRQRPRAPPRR